MRLQHNDSTGDNVAFVESTAGETAPSWLRPKRTLCTHHDIRRKTASGNWYCLKCDQRRSPRKGAPPGRKSDRWPDARGFVADRGIITTADAVLLFGCSAKIAGAVLRSWLRTSTPRLVRVADGVYALPETHERAKAEERRERAVLARIDARETEAAE